MIVGLLVAAPLMQLNDASSMEMSSVDELVAKEAEYEHRLSSLVRTGYRC